MAAGEFAPGIWADARVLIVHGPTAAEFLQGYLTCDTARINALKATPMAMCNVKGRVLASGWALTTKEGIGLIVHASLTERVEAFLKPYIGFSPCRLDPGSARWLELSPAGSGFELLPDLFARVVDAPPEANPSADPGVGEAMRSLLVERRFAFVSAPVSEEFLPQMLGLDDSGAVDFDKGCYLGQEIVARAQFRGAVKRGLAEFEWTGTAPAVGETWRDLGRVIEVDAHGRGLAIVSKPSA